jgi:hypothetical protein
MGSLERRLEKLEQLVEGRVEARVEEELEAIFDSLEQHLAPEELRRVLEILAADNDEEETGRGA